MKFARNITRVPFVCTDALIGANDAPSPEMFRCMCDQDAMGQTQSDEDVPPPSHSTLFVVRNGRYEAQTLMPVLPHRGYVDFDGFVVRRNANGVRTVHSLETVTG